MLLNAGFPLTGIGLGSIVSALELPVSVMMAFFILNEDAAIDGLHLSDTEYIVSEALQIKKQLSLVEIFSQL